MHATLKTQSLVSALQAATAAAAQSAGSLIELSAEGDELVVRGTDGELFVRRTPEIKELDINPLRILYNDSSAVALDARARIER